MPQPSKYVEISHALRCLADTKGDASLDATLDYDDFDHQVGTLDCFSLC